MRPYSVHAEPWHTCGGWQGDYATLEEAIAALPSMTEGMNSLSIRDIMGRPVWEMWATGASEATQTSLDTGRMTASGHTTVKTTAHGPTDDPAARARADLAAAVARLRQLVEVTEASFAVAAARGDVAAAEQARDQAIRTALAEHSGAAIAAATDGTGAPVSQQRVSQIRRGTR